MILKIWFNYFRERLLVVVIQTVIIQFGANLVIAPRFGIPEFTIGEVFVVCAMYMVLTHRLHIVAISNNVAQLKQIMYLYTTTHLKITDEIAKGTITLAQLRYEKNELIKNGHKNNDKNQST